MEAHLYQEKKLPFKYNKNKPIIKALLSQTYETWPYFKGKDFISLGKDCISLV